MLIATGVMTCASMAPAMAANPAPDDANKGWNLSVNGAITAGTEVQPGDYVDFNGDQNVSVSKDVKDGVKIVKVELNKDIDVNSVQTNALNAKYNLSVGTANDNGTMPFFVNSNGAFYAANGKLVVDKDGNVTAGNVVLNNGVFTGSSALRDGELFVGDASGSYSQITPKSAKLGQVTIDEKGNIAAVNSIQTNALNAKYNLSVGTANDNGTMPFFVNSNGAFYAANGKLVVDKDGNVTAGNVVLNNGVFTGSSALRDGELFVGDASGSYSQITPKSAKLGQVTIDEKGNIAGVNSIQTNALNAKYNLSVGTANENGTMPFFVNSNGAFYAANGSFVVDKDGKVTATAGEIGNVVLQNGVFTGHSALRDGELFVGDASGNYSQITTKGAKLGKVTVAADGKISGVAAGAVTADSTDAVNGSQLHAVATEAGKHSKVVNGSNINVEETDVDGQKFYKVNLNKDIMLGDLTGKYVNISGTNGTIETTGYIATKDRVYADKGAKLADIDVTGNKISNGASSIVLDGSNVKVNDKVTIDQNGKISGVAAGEISATSKDAVNGSQLYATNQEVANNTNRINQLGSRVNKVGAGAAALAALHPMDFDPDDKLTFSAGYGNYGGENAAAIGAYYRPDEKVMFSVGGTVGNGENMVNAGVSFSLDRTNHVSNSRTAMAREILDLRAEVTELKAMVAKGGLGSIAEDKMKIFPDVAENHWAYEYVGKLAAAGIIEGYPDGKFSGDRMMSRYEFAAMLYRAMQKGAQLDSKIINEFAPEMGRIRVDRISGEDGDRDKIERVRVNAVKGERDHYGNKIAKAEAKAK